MLFDPKWDSPYNATLDQLIDWLRTKPADACYSYSEPEKCALCVFLRDHGVENPYVTGTEWGWFEKRGDAADQNWLRMAISGFLGQSLWAYDYHLQALPLSFNNIAKGWPWTYGGALERAIRVRDANELRAPQSALAL